MNKNDELQSFEEFEERDWCSGISDLTTNEQMNGLAFSLQVLGYIFVRSERERDERSGLSMLGSCSAPPVHCVW